MKISARDSALVIVAGAIGAASALLLRLPTIPDENNLLGLAGSLIGAAIAVIAGLIVLGRQFETTDERHLRTVRGLLRALRVAGTSLLEPRAALDPPRHVHEATTLFRAVKSVSGELRATSALMALVAQMFEDEHVHGRLIQLGQPGLGISAQDLTNLGNEVVDIADAGLNALSSERD